MKLVGTSVRPELVARVVDILRMLGYRDVSLGQEPTADGAAARTDDEPSRASVRVEVRVKEVDAPGAAVALTRATSKDPHPVFVTDVAPVGAPSWG